MPTDKKLKNLVLNVLTEEQYDSATKNEDELYITPDNSDELEKVIPTDVGIKDNKLGLVHDTVWLTNQNAINLGNGLTYDKNTNTLSGNFASVSPTLWLVDKDTHEVRTNITEEEKTNLEKELYNQVIYMNGDYKDEINVSVPSKLFHLDVSNEYIFTQLNIFQNTITGPTLTIYTLSVGNKDSATNTYSITITKLDEVSAINVIEPVSIHEENNSITYNVSDLATVNAINVMQINLITLVGSYTLVTVVNNGINFLNQNPIYYSSRGMKMLVIDNTTFSEENDTVTYYFKEITLPTQVVSIVNIDAKEDATNGTITTEQLSTLQANDANYVMFNHEKYYLGDKGHKEGFLTYSHVGFENGNTFIKSITITISTKAWVLNTTQVRNISVTENDDGTIDMEIA